MIEIFSSSGGDGPSADGAEGVHQENTNKFSYIYSSITKIN
jgi:hypothetical protein